ncbi:MAG: hypothetical protein V3V13_06020 [Paracoccaceae bacterium]
MKTYLLIAILCTTGFLVTTNAALAGGSLVSNPKHQNCLNSIRNIRA